MLNIIKADLTGEIKSVSFVWDIFVFSYLSVGINFTDIANIKSGNIIDGRLQYIRQKTSKEISLHLSPSRIHIRKNQTGRKCGQFNVLMGIY
ncbi:MAG TPA: hypothetical protein VFC67_06095 [Prolixibacteraceae bacterium]|nr:hypothetical protein [Prolixibacteraceae bacterium]